jgi:hypothetical protein
MLQETSRAETKLEKESKAKLPERNAKKVITFNYDAQRLMSSKDNVK